MKRLRSRILVTVSSLAIVVALLLVAATIQFQKHSTTRYQTIPPVELTAEMKMADVSIGERIVRVRNACTQCHGDNLAGKVFVDGAPGRFAGPNITPYALSSWSDGEIARAIRYAIGRDHLPLLIMPSDNFQHLSKQDVASVIAYLRSVPSIATPNQKNEVRTLTRVLYLFGKVPNLFPVERVDLRPQFEEKPQESVSAEFGRYVVRTSCMGCHRENLAGGRIQGGPPSWPSASDLRPSAIGGWNKTAFIQTLRTGVNPSGRRLRVPMPIEMTRQMSDTELGAIWLYLKSI